MGQLTLTIGHLYPDLMSIYGDRGNVIALAQRARWRGVDVTVRPYLLGEPLDPDEVDILFIGGGQDRQQMLVCQDLQGVKQGAIKAAVESGVVLLAICGGYQLLGHYFLAVTGENLPGLGLLDVHTIGGKKRCIGNLIVEVDLRSWASAMPANTRSPVSNLQLIGFENHSGRTYLGPGAQPLGRVIAGFGNNGEDGYEGARYKNVFGTYMHGSLLPKNPWFADYLMLTALQRRYGPGVTLAPLDDRMEIAAHDAVVDMVLAGRVDRL